MSLPRLLFFFLALTWTPLWAIQEWRILALRVDFPREEPDQPTTTGQGGFDLRSRGGALPGYLLPFDTPPHDRRYFERHLRALDRYYRAVSAGQVEIDFAVFPTENARAYTLPQPALFYGSGRTQEEIGRRWAELVSQAVALADADPRGPRFAEFNSLLILHAGVGHETGELNDIRSVYLSPQDLQTYLDRPLAADEGQTLLRDAWVLPETVSPRGQAGLNGLLAKFFGHQLGLPGLSNFKDGLPAVGGWSLMDVGANRFGYVLQGDSLKAVFGFVPPHPEAWSKAQLGWIEPLEVRRDTTVQLAAADRGGTLALRVPIAQGEYFLIENRQQRGRRGAPPGVHVPFGDEEAVWLDSTQFQVEEGVWIAVEEYDAFVPGSGVLIWHVDERLIEERFASNSINDDPVQPGLALEEADGHRDIGNPVFERLDQIEGAPQDPFYAGGDAVFGPRTRPDTRSNQGLESGIEIEVLSPPGDTVQVRISFAQVAAGWPITVGQARRLQGADVDGDGKVELLVESEAGVQMAEAESGIIWSIPGARLLGAADLDEDGKAEIFAAQGNEVSAWKAGSAEPVWRRAVGMEPVSGLFSREQDLLSGWSALALSGEQVVILDGGTGEVMQQQVQRTTALARADLDGDGQGELILSGEGGGWKLKSEKMESLWGGSSLTPAAGDLDGDGRDELVVAWPQGQVQVIGGQGWHLSLGDSLRAAPVIGDLDGDGFLEIIATGLQRVHALRADGKQQADFPVELPRYQRAGDLHVPPILLDLDGDGRQEIFVGTRNGVYGIGEEGELLAGFPLLTGEGVEYSPLGADLDGDGELELAALAGQHLYLWDPAEFSAVYKGRSAGWGQAGASAAGANAHEAGRLIPAAGPVAPLLERVYCYPNPVGQGEEAHLRFSLNQPARVEVEVFDAIGERIGRLAAQGALAENELAWSVANYPSGLYLCRLAARAADGQQAVVLVKMAVSK